LGWHRAILVLRTFLELVLRSVHIRLGTKENNQVTSKGMQAFDGHVKQERADQERSQ